MSKHSLYLLFPHFLYVPLIRELWTSHASLHAFSAQLGYTHIEGRITFVKLNSYPYSLKTLFLLLLLLLLLCHAFTHQIANPPFIPTATVHSYYFYYQNPKNPKKTQNPKIPKIPKVPKMAGLTLSGPDAPARARKGHKGGSQEARKASRNLEAPSGP